MNVYMWTEQKRKMMPQLLYILLKVNLDLDPMEMAISPDIFAELKQANPTRFVAFNKHRAHRLIFALRIKYAQ